MSMGVKWGTHLSTACAVTAQAHDMVVLGQAELGAARSVLQTKLLKCCSRHLAVCSALTLRCCRAEAAVTEAQYVCGQRPHPLPQTSRLA